MHDNFSTLMKQIIEALKDVKRSNYTNKIQTKQMKVQIRKTLTTQEKYVEYV